VAPLALYVLVYVATLFLAGWLAVTTHTRFHYWIFLGAAVVATVAAIGIVDKWRWDVGLAAPPAVAIRELLAGIVFAGVLLAIADGLILATTTLRHQRNDGFPWLELVAVFVPAVLHEELVFRGYVFQKLRAVHRWTAILLTALVFAALHSGNSGVTRLALLNIFAAGILLALTYERAERLWMPIGLHLGWNLVSGPILGYNVSGYSSASTVWRTIGGGAPMLTGGAFGIEGSVLTLVVVVLGSAWLERSNMMRRRRVASAGIAAPKEPS
jgi:CAAX protease family protein